MPRGKKSGRAASGDGSIQKKIVKKNGRVGMILKPSRATLAMDAYGHVTEQMKRDSVERMQKFIKSVSG